MGRSNKDAKKIIIFGLGEDYRENKYWLLQKANIIAFTVNDKSLWGCEVDGVRVHSPSEVKVLPYDKVVIASNRYLEEMRRQLLELGVDRGDIWSLDDLRENLFAMGVGVNALVSRLGIGEFSRWVIYFFLMAAMSAAVGLLYKNTLLYVVKLLLLVVPLISLVVPHLYARNMVAYRQRPVVRLHFIVHAWAFAQLSIIVSSFWRGYLQAGIFLITAFFVDVAVLCIWGYYFVSGAFFDVLAAMALLQTNKKEMFGYLKSFVNKKCLLAVLLMLFVNYLDIIYSIPLVMGVSPLLWLTSLGVVCIVCVACLRFFQQDYFYLLKRGVKLALSPLVDFQAKLEEREKQLLECNIVAESGYTRGVYVLVIGESHSRDHMNVYGYSRENTPWLMDMEAKVGFLRFEKAFSCNTLTMHTVQSALTAQNQYNYGDPSRSFSLVEVAGAAGYRTAWLSAQEKCSIGNNFNSVIAETADTKVWLSNISQYKDTCYDEYLVDELRKLEKNERMLIVIHLMGSHFPYAERYPKNFNCFGERNRVDAYDNSVLYNDYVMKEIFEEVAVWPDFRGLIYFSDHGEEVDKGYNHDPNSFTYAMTHIPFYMYFSEKYREENPEKYERLKAHQRDYFTNDLIYDTMLGIMGINIESYEPESDLTNVAYDADPNRFTTLFGKIKIVDEESERL